ncbi:hypothetical protein EDB85DRAFT_2022484, partial [Lactarius pseudohatsudake]
CVLSLAIFLYSPRAVPPIRCVHPNFLDLPFTVTLVSCITGSPRVCLSDSACCMYSQLVLSTHFFLHLFVLHFSTIHTMYP